MVGLVDLVGVDGGGVGVGGVGVGGGLQVEGSGQHSGYLGSGYETFGAVIATSGVTTTSDTSCGNGEDTVFVTVVLNIMKYDGGVSGRLQVEGSGQHSGYLGSGYETFGAVIATSGVTTTSDTSCGNGEDTVFVAVVLNIMKCDGGVSGRLQVEGSGQHSGYLGSGYETFGAIVTTSGVTTTSDTSCGNVSDVCFVD